MLKIHFVVVCARGAFLKVLPPPPQPPYEAKAFHFVSQHDEKIKLWRGFQLYGLVGVIVFKFYY